MSTVRKRELRSYKLKSRFCAFDQYEECDSDDDHAIDELPMLYSFRVHMDYIRSRVRWFNEVRRRPTGSDGKTLSDLDAASATLQENIDGGCVTLLVRYFTVS
jgi:hypothetical protein